jgi:hypothetical protein
MHKRIITIIAILLVLPFVNSDGGGDQVDQHELIIGPSCSQASFCEEGYILRCSTDSDNLCPEDYGDWSACRDNIYDGIKCFPCDPDCGTCGDIDAVLNPEVNEPNGQFYIPTTITNPDQINYYVLYTRGSGYGLQEGSSFAVRQCTQTSCTFTDVYTFAPNVGGQEFEIEMELGHIYGGEYIPTELIIAQGVTTPIAMIVNPEEGIVYPEEGAEESGTLDIRVDAESSVNSGQDDNIQTVKYYLYKYNDQYNEYQPADANTCRLSCQETDCNLIQQYTDYNIPRNQDDEVIYNWDTTRCDNKNYKLIVNVSDKLSSASDEVEFSLNNANPPCVDECSRFSSNVFKSILAKIKVWL